MTFTQHENRIIGALSLGEAQRPTSFLIATAIGAPAIGLPPKFKCIYVHRYKTSTAMASIADNVALTLNLDRLRTVRALSRLLDSAFDHAKIDLVIDTTLVGESTFAEFARLRQTNTLALNELIALKVSSHGDRSLDPDYIDGVTWYRLPRTELAGAMRAALDAEAFEVCPSVQTGLRKAALREFRLFQGKTGMRLRTSDDPTPDDDILHAAMAAVWHGSQALPLEHFYPPAQGFAEPVKSWPPVLDMSRHLCHVAPRCGQCGYNYPEEHSIILTCPKCKADRGFIKPPARTEFIEPSRPQLRWPV